MVALGAGMSSHGQDLPDVSSPTDSLTLPPSLVCRLSRRRSRLPPLPALLAIPESKMYADLVEMEQKLDWTITRKKVEVQDAVGRPTKVSTRSLRSYAGGGRTR